MEWWLLMQLKAGNPRTRRQAVEKLSRTPSSKVVEAVVPLLRDRDLNVRKAAATALGNMKDDRAAAFLVAALQNPSAGVRLEAADALAAALPLLKDGESQVRRAAVDALVKLRDLRADLIRTRFMVPMRGCQAKEAFDELEL